MARKIGSKKKTMEFHTNCEFLTHQEKIISKKNLVYEKTVPTVIGSSA